MTPLEFKHEIDTALDKAQKAGLPLYAVVGVMQCQISDMIRTSAMAHEQMAAKKFAEEMATSVAATKAKADGVDLKRNN